MAIMRELYEAYTVYNFVMLVSEFRAAQCCSERLRTAEPRSELL
jgi:hypothetical protein